jgi:zinc dependent phospholipase C
LNRGTSRHRRKRKILVRSACLILAGVLLTLFPLQTFSYAILAHQAIIDVVWESQLKPLLHQNYPQATEEELNAAEAYAYGGSIIQDLGYYPYGSPFFSDLAHYVRSGDFITALLRNSHDVYDYAFALGALAHGATDINGHHIATNRSVPILYPKLQKKFGDEVTYEDNPLAHLKTEFGFDVLQVARGNYASEDFHDYIGFEVSQPLLDQAFQETYGLELKNVFVDEDKALNSYRRDVSKLIPRATRIAWSLKSKEIQPADSSAAHRKFLYSLSRAEYEKEWGKNYTKPKFSDRFLAFLLKLLPKFGPLKVLQLRMPTPETERLFEASFNASLDSYRHMLAQVRKGDLKLANANLDVGSETAPGKYRLGDYAHAKLLHELAKQKFQGVTPEIRSEILEFFASPDALDDVKKDAKTWKRLQSELQQLRQFQLSAAPPTNAHVPLSCVTSVTLR